MHRGVGRDRVSRVHTVVMTDPRGLGTAALPTTEPKCIAGASSPPQVAHSRRMQRAVTDDVVCQDASISRAWPRLTILSRAHFEPVLATCS